jgi:tRNA1Val (adenine37-N6)-methyltransferase
MGVGPSEATSEQAGPALTDAEVTSERLGPFSFLQLKNSHRLTSDTLLLADFIPPLNVNDKLIDLGTSTGAIPLLLADRYKEVKLTGVEIDKAVFELAERNVTSNNLTDRITLYNKDWRELRSVYAEGSFTHVVSNPPYVKAGHGRVSPNIGRAIARSEQAGTLKELIDISAYLAGEGGRIYYVFTASRYDEMLKALATHGLKPGRVCFVHTKKDETPQLFLIEAGQGLELEVMEAVTLQAKFHDKFVL